MSEKKEDKDQIKILDSAKISETNFWGAPKSKSNQDSKVKILDINAVIMIICLAFIFSLTVLNKIGILTSWILYALLGLFLVIMVFFLMRSIKKSKEVKV